MPKGGEKASTFDVRRSKFDVRPKEPGFWARLVWALVFPRRRQRIVPTVSGVLLIGLSIGLGTAAYNAANNILFMTLALLLACLVLSGVLSWLNIRRVEWTLEAAGPWRAGQEATVALGLRNEKTVLPTYGLWFDVTARPVPKGEPARAETTFTAKGIDVRAALAAAETRAGAQGTMAMRARLDPGAGTRLEWSFRPATRGRLRIELAGVGSLFPFGFLRKEFSTDESAEVVVWPAAVEYRRLATMAARHAMGGERIARAGTGGDLLALRRYAPGDSHRLVHWKASARAGRLLVRQFAAENAEGFRLWVGTDAAVWTRPEQFELMLGFAATLAEDLFRSGGLAAVALEGEVASPVRRVRDVEAFFDRLAVVEVGGERQEARGERTEGGGGGRRNLITFAPEGPRGVAAWVNGELLAQV